jgi:hypothetical protein
MFLAGRIETTTNQNYFAYLVVSIWAWFRYAHKERSLLDHQPYSTTVDSLNPNSLLKSRDEKFTHHNHHL